MFGLEDKAQRHGYFLSRCFVLRALGLQTSALVFESPTFLEPSCVNPLKAYYIDISGPLF
jgi:hypothetical protein